MDSQVFQANMAGLIEYYAVVRNHKPLSKAVIRMYWDMFKDFEDRVFIEACKQHLATSPFFPTIADLMALMRPRKEQYITDQAYGVVRAVREIGYYGTPKFDDPRTANAVSKMGWGKLCATLHESDLTWFIKDFREAYEASADVPMITAGEAKQIMQKIHDRIAQK